MLAQYNLYHTHAMTTRLGAQIEAIGNYNTRSARYRLDELLGQEILSEILEFAKETESFQLGACAKGQLGAFESSRVGAKVSDSQFVLIFDTETTGLLPKNMPKNWWELTNEELREYPYITQLSAVLYDVANQKVSDVFNTYIRIPDDVVIPDIVTQITGITREKCDGGMPIKEALVKFHKMWKSCENIVAHNMWFDSKMLKLEYKRNQMYCDIFKNYDTMHCTMIAGMRYIGANRFVKLSYLYESLFGALPDVQLHNSLVDTIVCLRCYLKVFCDQELSDKEFGKMIKKLV